MSLPLFLLSLSLLTLSSLSLLSFSLFSSPPFLSSFMVPNSFHYYGKSRKVDPRFHRQRNTLIQFDRIELRIDTMNRLRA